MREKRTCIPGIDLLWMKSPMAERSLGGIERSQEYSSSPTKSGRGILGHSAGEDVTLLSSVPDFVPIIWDATRISVTTALRPLPVMQGGAAG
jgi:hypothetical protein